MPAYAVERIQEILKGKKRLAQAKILVVGVTYKKDVKDLRKSPSLQLIELLQKKRVKTDYFDPIIPYLKIGTIDLKSIKLSKSALAKYDCVIIATDHTRVNYRLIAQSARCIFDVRNVYGKIKSKKIHKI